MKVILLKDVPKIGLRNDIKDVSDGHALNFLLPQGLAETATEKAIKRVELIKKQEAEQKKIKIDLMLKNFGDLKGVSIEIEKIANKEGHLFASIHPDEIVVAVKEQTRLDIDSDCIVLAKQIKSVGEHDVEVRVGDRAVKFTLIVKGLPEEHHKGKNKE
jgi:large subunit ribosomal protein L9